MKDFNLKRHDYCCGIVLAGLFCYDCDWEDRSDVPSSKLLAKIIKATYRPPKWPWSVDDVIKELNIPESYHKGLKANLTNGDLGATCDSRDGEGEWLLLEAEFLLPEGLHKETDPDDGGTHTKAIAWFKKYMNVVQTTEFYNPNTGNTFTRLTMRGIKPFA